MYYKGHNHQLHLLSNGFLTEPTGLLYMIVQMDTIQLLRNFSLQGMEEMF